MEDLFPQLNKVGIILHYSFFSVLLLSCIFGGALYAAPQSDTENFIFPANKLSSIIIQIPATTVAIYPATTDNAHIQVHKESFDPSLDSLSVELSEATQTLSILCQQGPHSEQPCQVNLKCYLPPNLMCQIKAGMLPLCKTTQNIRHFQVEIGTGNLILNAPIELLDCKAGMLSLKATAIRGPTKIECGQGVCELIFETPSDISRQAPISFQSGSLQTVMQMPRGSTVAFKKDGWNLGNSVNLSNQVPVSADAPYILCGSIASGSLAIKLVE